jgi:hypothetical protein
LGFFIDALISIVGESHSVVVEASGLSYAEEASIGEGFDMHLGDIFEEIVVIKLNDVVGLKIDDVDFAFGDVQDDDFLLIHHSEEVNDVFVLMLP